MTKKIKIIIILYLMSIALTFVIVPWKIENYIPRADRNIKISEEIRYDMFFSHPNFSVSGYQRNYATATVEYQIILIEIAGITALFGAIYVLSTVVSKRLVILAIASIASIGLSLILTLIFFRHPIAEKPMPPERPLEAPAPAPVPYH